MAAETRLWYDKYRPTSFNDYVWTDDHLKELVADWITKKSIPSIMLAGGPGRGKSSLADLIITELGVEESDVLRLKGSKDNNVETMRTRVQEFCELGGWSESGLRIVFFDEADMLSRSAQEALRNIIDEFSVAGVRFIFTCNHPHRIEKAVADSRMFRLDIEKMPEDDFMQRLGVVLEGENVQWETEDGVNAVLKTVNLCYPDLRKAINLLQNSVRDGILKSVTPIHAATETWETYITELMIKSHDPVREVCKIRETLMGLTPDEMEEVYKFLYHNGAKLFADKQVQSIFAINNGQKAHRNALLPDMILLEVLIRLMLLNNEQE